MSFHAGRFFEILTRMEQHMGAIADALQGVPEALNTAKDAIVTEIAGLQNEAAAGGLDDADKAALQAIKDAAAGVEAIVPPAAPAPTSAGADPTTPAPADPTASA